MRSRSKTTGDSQKVTRLKRTLFLSGLSPQCGTDYVRELCLHVCNKCTVRDVRLVPHARITSPLPFSAFFCEFESEQQALAMLKELDGRNFLDVAPESRTKPPDAQDRILSAQRPKALLVKIRKSAGPAPKQEKLPKKEAKVLVTAPATAVAAVAVPTAAEWTLFCQIHHLAVHSSDFLEQVFRLAPPVLSKVMRLADRCGVKEMQSGNIGDFVRRLACVAIRTTESAGLCARSAELLFSI